MTASALPELGFYTGRGANEEEIGKRSDLPVAKPAYLTGSVG